MLINGIRVYNADYLGARFMDRIVPTPEEKSTRIGIKIILSLIYGNKTCYRSVEIPFKMDLSRLREFQEYCLYNLRNSKFWHLSSARIVSKIAIAYPHKHYVLYDQLPKDIYQG